MTTPDTDRVLPGPGGSAEARSRLALESEDASSVRDVRKIATIDGSEIREGEAFFELPAWFVRTGRTRCEIDTGFGIVKMKTVAIEEDTLMHFAQGSPKAAKKMLRGIISIPDDWEAEEDVQLGRGHVIREGTPIPTPVEMADRPPVECAKYIAEFFPRSLITQIVTAYQFMVMPPIAYTEVDSD